MTQFLTAQRGIKNISIGVLDEFMEWQMNQATGNADAFMVDRAVADMYRAVELRALGVATMPFRIESDKGKTLTDSGNYQDVTGFFPKPRRMLTLVEQSRALTGTAYLYNNANRYGYTKAVEFIPPQAVKPVYVNNIAGGTLQEWTISTARGWQTYALPQIVYDWLPDASVGNAPPRRYPASAALSAAGIQLNLDKFVEIFFKRGAIKATIFTTEGNPPKLELERMEAWAETWLTGLVNAFRTKFFPVGKVNPLVIGEGIKELENQDLEASQSRKIAKAMMIPMAIFNSESSAGLGGGGVASQDEINFLKQCRMPECDAIAEAWNEQLFIPNGYKWIFEYEKLDELHDDENALADTALKYADLVEKCATFEEWDALADMTGFEYDEAKFLKVFAMKDQRRQETQAQLQAAQANQPPAQGNYQITKPEPPQLTAGDNAKNVGGTDGLVILSGTNSNDGNGSGNLDSVPIAIHTNHSTTEAAKTIGGNDGTITGSGSIAASGGRGGDSLGVSDRSAVDSAKAIGGNDGNNLNRVIAGANNSQSASTMRTVELLGVETQPQTGASNYQQDVFGTDRGMADPTQAAKALERKQFRAWSAKRAPSEWGKFSFKYLDESEQAALTQKKTVSVKSIGGVSQRFQAELTQLVTESWRTQGGKITRDMNALVTQYVDDSFADGMLEGGSTPEQMTADDYALVNSLEAGQTQYIAKFASDVLDAATDAAQQQSILARVALWAESIYSIGQRGWVAAQNKTKARIQWHVANDELTCNICSPLNDKIVKAGEPFGYDADGNAIYNEPAHPHCRCSTTTYVE